MVGMRLWARERTVLRAGNAGDRRHGLSAILTALALASALVPPSSRALPVAAPVFDLALRRGESPDGLTPRAAPERSDTLWFGGDDGHGLAVAGGVWDWDTIVSDPLQGWTSVDMTANPGVYFGRVTADSFIVHGDGCIPLFPGSTGMLWCGVHEDEANERDFAAGMGYQNDMCQRALSPRLAIDPVANSVLIRFRYFNDTEEGYDHTRVYLLGLGVSDELLDELLLASFDGVIGSPSAPAFHAGQVLPGTLSPDVVRVQLEFRMTADLAYSDEDGNWDTQCGPFGADDVELEVGAADERYDFEDGSQGWSFAKCEGIGVYTAVVPEGTWSPWLGHAGVLCECLLSGNALGLADMEHSPFWPPGHPVGQHEMAISGTVAWPAGFPDETAACVAQWHQYDFLRHDAGTWYRPGYMYYPHTTEVNPVPHWSPRMGQATWFYTGDDPSCDSREAKFSSPPDGSPLPADWDSLRAVYEVVCGCEYFSIPPSVCEYEGQTWGSPLIDRYRVGLTAAPDAPQISLETGHSFQDGFGQQFPEYLEPSDAGNSNVWFDISRSDERRNDWLADTALVRGPAVDGEAGRWCVDLCLRVARAGPRQGLIPGYEEWKTRFATDPEVDWACARMDSNQTGQGAFANKYETYFHESDPGFDPHHPDRSAHQEILPDGLLVPGTRVEYSYRSYWYDGGAPPDDYFVLGPWEFEILPGMRPGSGGYDIEYPSVLYVDAYERGAEYYLAPLLTTLGVDFDKYDSQGAPSCCDAPMRRSYGGTYYNPGGWGNNGCSDHQLLAYRLILVDSGTFGQGGFWTHNSMVPAPNWVLLENWLEATTCELGALRRGLILSGDGIAAQIDDEDRGHPEFLHSTLGVAITDPSYRDYNGDEAYCVHLEPAEGAAFSPLDPGIALYGNGCPRMFDYGVLGSEAGVSGVVGNLRYHSYEGTGSEPYVDFAQVVREKVEPGAANWTTVVNGFSLFHLAERDCHGADCSGDSACVVNAGLDLLIPQILGWTSDPEDPFVAWRYPCVDTEVEADGSAELGGPASYLYASRPNPFTRAATIRFRLAREGEVRLGIYDVSGRRVKELVGEALAPGEHARVWDGTDEQGREVGAGLFWMQLTTAQGYASAKRMIVLK